VNDKDLGYVLRRGVVEIIVEEELVRLLESGKRLRLKMGFDPSRPDIHLGHVVGIRKLRQFQDLGHQVVLIVGDWTARIGDPSGESQTRPMLSADEVRVNAETYMQQFFKVVDRGKTELRWQSEWFGEFGLEEVISLTSKFTVAQLLAREDFGKRYASERPIAVTELLYPLLQAYDSVAIEADVEFGGIDQKFNCLMGRELQQMMGQTPQHVFLMPLLVGTDGQQKMSKSLDNYIAIEDPPNEMYGKVMSIPDHLMIDYFELLTDPDRYPDDVLADFSQQLDTGANPMGMKKILAAEIVRQFHGQAAAVGARGEFERVFQAGAVPEDIKELRISFEELRISFSQYVDPRVERSSSDLLEQIRVDDRGTVHMDPVGLAHVLSRYGIVKSNAEAKRLIAESAVDFIYPDGRKVTVGKHPLYIRNGSIIKVGKRRWIKTQSSLRFPSPGEIRIKGRG
jgi:tyrosyl-tRNA synthetase